VAFSPRAQAITYAGGSLIIPTQSSYQDYCGTASAYGLVYNVLRANDGLAAIGKSRITVHWAYKATKASPNRCVPTNIQNPPVYGSYTTSNPPPWNDAIWNDGCDFRVTDNSSVPVKLVKNSTGLSADDTNITTINTTADTAVYPNYGSVTIQQTTNPKVTSVGYLGGPFVIAAVRRDRHHPPDREPAGVDLGVGRPRQIRTACSTGSTGQVGTPTESAMTCATTPPTPRPNEPLPTPRNRPRGT